MHAFFLPELGAKPLISRAKNRFLVMSALLLLVSSCELPGKVSNNYSEGQILTVNGPVPPGEIGTTLIHEHVFLDWSGADSTDPSSWPNETAYEYILPYLEEMKSRGVQTFMECTPAYLGRNPRLLRQLANATGLHILTNTGLYAARKNQYIPEFVWDISAKDLAQKWIDEFHFGIEGTGIFPGFIKIGMDSKERLTEMDKKLVIAAAHTHASTGLTIVAHTGTDTTAIQELQILEVEGIAPEAFVWTHAQRGTKKGHVRLARKGAWISLDGMGYIRPDTKEQDSSALNTYVGFLENLKQNDLLDKTLISHDAGWFTVGAESQKNYKGYTLIFDLLIPVLSKQGFSQEDIDQLLRINPPRAYGIKKRLLTSH